MRKYVSRRLLALSEGEIAALTTSMRQIGVGTQGGAEALAIFHQLLYDEWMTGSVDRWPESKSTRKNCFGMIQWQAVREAASRFLPKHTAAAAWKHRNLSHVEQEGLPPMPKDRGAEQGDVDGRWSAAWLWEWWRLKHGNTWLLSRRQAAFRGLVLMAPQMFSASKQSAQSNCKKQPTSSWVARRSSSESTTRGTCYRRTEAWRTCGTWTAVAFCVTQS